MLLLSVMLTNPTKALHRLFLAIARLFPSSHYALLSLLFIVGLELIFVFQRWYFLVSALVVSLITFGVILVSYEEEKRFMPTQVILPILATLGISGFAFLLPTTWILHVYIATAGLILFFLLKHGARQSYPIWNWALSMGIYLLNIAFIFGLRFHLDWQILFVLASVFIITALMSLQALRRIVPTISDVVLPVLALSFALTEVSWALQFLPSHYLAQAGLLAVLYYVIFNLISLSYTARLTLREMVEYIGVGTIASIIIISASRWT